MNCKPGDLAIIVSCMNDGGEKYIGNIVTCLKLNTGSIAWWEVQGNIGHFVGVADANLKPLRDSEGTDEMLLITGKPKEKVHE